MPMVMLLLAACQATIPCEASWEPGTLLIRQLDLPASATGESAIVVGPDGTSVLVDVGNDSHADDVRAALTALSIDRPDHVVLTHDHQDHVGAADELLAGGPEPIRWDTELPRVLPLGDGAELVLFLGNGRLALDSGVVQLDVDIADDVNAHSLAGVVSWGDFTYLFAGDLTGGGKNTPNVERAVVAHAAELPWVPASGVDVLHVSHHGISSSTSAPWVDWLRPRVAVVGANDLYLDAPSPEALAALHPWVDAVWVTESGRLGNRDDRTHVAHGPVSVVVGAAGDLDVCGTTHGTIAR